MGKKHPGCLICDGGAVGMNPQAFNELSGWHLAGHPKATGQVMSPQAILRTPDPAKASPEAETQLTLQEGITNNDILNALAYDDAITIQSIKNLKALFQQALTSLKTGCVDCGKKRCENCERLWQT